MYKDMLLKIEYYKEYILKAFIKQGYFPDKEDINNKLSEIDERVALFKKYKFTPGENFNAKEMNHMLLMLMYDIIFLYKVVQSIYEEKYSNLILEIETQMTWLENLADYYKKRSDEEINSTSLGKTLLFKTGDWEIETNDETTDINIGQLELIQGAEISCFANINNVDKKNIIFEFSTQDSSKDFKALPYNYNNDTYIVPGEIEVKDHEITLSTDFILSNEIYLTIEDGVNIDNDYKVLGGKNKIVITNKLTNKSIVQDMPTIDKPLEINSDSYISFYIENKGDIEYKFNKRPANCNFAINNGVITIDKPLKKIFLDVNKGFICYFDIYDNNCYAICEEPKVSKSHLTHNSSIIVSDFKIKEYIKNKTTNYYINVKILETDRDEVVDCVYIKEVD